MDLPHSIVIAINALSNAILLHPIITRYTAQPSATHCCHLFLCGPLFSSIPLSLIVLSFYYNLFPCLSLSLLIFSFLLSLIAIFTLSYWSFSSLPILLMHLFPFHLGKRNSVGVVVPITISNSNVYSQQESVLLSWASLHVQKAHGSKGTQQGAILRDWLLCVDITNWFYPVHTSCSTLLPKHYSIPLSPLHSMMRLPRRPDPLLPRILTLPSHLSSHSPPPPLLIFSFFSSRIQCWGRFRNWLRIFWREEVQFWICSASAYYRFGSFFRIVQR